MRNYFVVIADMYHNKNFYFIFAIYSYIYLLLNSTAWGRVYTPPGRTESKFMCAIIRLLIFRIFFMSFNNLRIRLFLLFLIIFFLKSLCTNSI